MTKAGVELDQRSPTRRRMNLGRLTRISAAGAALVALTAARPSVGWLHGAFAGPIGVDDLKRLAALVLWCVAIAFVLATVARAISSRPAARLRSDPPHTADRPSPKPPRLGARPSTPQPMMLIRLPREVGDGPLALGPRTGADEGESADASGEPLIQIGLLGPFTLVTPSGRRIKRTATRALIAYLALHPHGATRDELLEALWPDGDPRRTGPRLAQSVSEARKHLGDALRRDEGRYTLDRDLVTVDTDVLLAPDEADRTMPGTVDPTELVRGLPLMDIDAMWADAHRARLVTLAQESLVRVGRADLARGDHRHALHTAEIGLALEELNEALWHILLRAHAALGARTAVADSYQRLVSTLDRDLGVSPSRDTQMLYRELLAADTRGVSH